MKKALCYLLVFFVATYANSQMLGSITADTVIHHKKQVVKIITAKPAKIVFVEFGGNSVFTSVNFDTRLSKQLNGLGVRVGVGYFSLNSHRLLSFPVGINLLTGKNNHFFEFGINLTPVSSKLKSNATFTGVIPEVKLGQIVFTNGETQVVFGLPFGYRYQSTTKAFNFRVGVDPLIGKRTDGNMVTAVSAHISFGYTF